MTQVPPVMGDIMNLLRDGRHEDAAIAVDTALAQEARSPVLLELAAMLAGRRDDHTRAAELFAELLPVSTDPAKARRNLVGALIRAERFEEAENAIGANAVDDAALARMAAFLYQRRGDLDAAIAAYQRVVAVFPQDLESWNNLGNALAERGDLPAAAEALDRAMQLGPDRPQIYLNLSNVLMRLDRSQERHMVMRRAIQRYPDNCEILIELGMAESMVRDFAAAERAFARAIRLTRGFSPAYIELGLLYENLNRIDDLAALVADADAARLPEAELDFLRAWLFRRQGRVEEALVLAERVPETINPIRREQLLAELYDRAGRADEAFTAFERMNGAAVRARPAPQGPSYRQTVTSEAGLITPENIAVWTRPKMRAGPASPIFIVGFPRSGTTLLDTLLMNLPSLHVLEEVSILPRVQDALGSIERLSSLTDGDVARLRSLYFHTLEEMAPAAPGSIVVDKFPLHMAKIPLVHRIFPDARIVMVERHPYDAVLSCFMANFQLNTGMRSFSDLTEAALTYDTVMDAWERATSLLPVNVHRIRYERMIDDLEGEMRALLSFLGIPWDERVLNNQASAAKRPQIRTASYSQVTEPLYRRAVERWRRYVDHLAPIIPILEPWARRMEYDS